MINFLVKLGNNGIYQFDSEDELTAIVEVNKRFSDMSWKLINNDTGNTYMEALSTSESMLTHCWNGEGIDQNEFSAEMSTLEANKLFIKHHLGNMVYLPLTGWMPFMFFTKHRDQDGDNTYWDLQVNEFSYTIFND